MAVVTQNGSKLRRIAGWVLTILLALFLVGASAMGKFTEWEGKAETLHRMGFTADLLFQIGILEVALAVLFVIPRTAFLAAILLTGYLGGATVTHLRVGEPFYAPIIVGIVIWVALGLRNPRVFSLALGSKAVAN